MKVIKPVKSIHGRIVLPGDKSISHRAIIIGALSEGVTGVSNMLDCDDCRCTSAAFRQMGVKIKKDCALTLIEGVGLSGLRKPSGPLNMGESGTSIRLLSGILAGQKFESKLVCAQSLSKRPMRRIAEPLSHMGARIQTAGGGFPPLKIEGRELKAISYVMPVASAQVKSAILFAGMYATGVTNVREPAKSRDHTERMLEYFGAKVTSKGLAVSIAGPARLKARSMRIPCDISSAAFFMVAASILEGSKITIPGVCINPTRAGILKIMQRMGADLKISNRKSGAEPTGDVTVCSARTKGIVISPGDIPGVIDELPAIFVLAALSRGKTIIKGVGELRVKETDRIASMKYNLESMGARVIGKGSDMIIVGIDTLRPAKLKSFGDHRTCMAATIAALRADGESVIDDPGCVSKSFPEFFDILDKASKYV